MNVTLTKDADKTLCLIYKEYLSRRKNGVSKSDAIEFDFRKTINDLNIVNASDFSDELLELKDNNFIKMYVTSDFELLPSAIIYMENRFKNGLIEVTDFIAKFIP